MKKIPTNPVGAEFVGNLYIIIECHKTIITEKEGV